MRGLPQAVCSLLLPTALLTQALPDARATRPERPTVATHAWTFAPRYLELETGVEWDHNADGSRAFSTPTLLKLGAAGRTQVGILASLNRPPGAGLGPGDVTLLLKQRFADRVPILGAFAVIPGLKLPTGTAPHGTTTTDWSLLLISSNNVGSLSLDVNVGYTYRSGNGTQSPRNATLWTIATGGPLAGRVGFAAELFGVPATRGPAGARGAAGLIAGPTLAVRPWMTLDLGAIVHVHGPQPDAIYCGLVYNMGRL